MKNLSVVVLFILGAALFVAGCGSKKILVRHCERFNISEYFICEEQ